MSQEVRETYFLTYLKFNFIFLISRYLLSFYYVTDSFLGSRDTEETRQKKSPCSPGTHVLMGGDRKQRNK